MASSGNVHIKFMVVCVINSLSFYYVQLDTISKCTTQIENKLFTHGLPRIYSESYEQYQQILKCNVFEDVTSKLKIFISNKA